MAAPVILRLSRNDMPASAAFSGNDAMLVMP